MNRRNLLLGLLGTVAAGQVAKVMVPALTGMATGGVVERLPGLVGEGGAEAIISAQRAAIMNAMWMDLPPSHAMCRCIMVSQTVYDHLMAHPAIQARTQVLGRITGHRACATVEDDLEDC